MLTASAMGPQTLAALASVVARSAFRSWKTWPAAVVVLSDLSKPRVLPRGVFARELLAGDLPALARECMTRRVSAGQLLAFVSVDGEDLSGTHFVVLALHTPQKDSHAHCK